MTSTLRRLAALTFGALALASCANDQPTAVQRTAPVASGAPSASLLGSLTSLLSVNGLQRTTPLAAPITVSKVIGSAGGTLSIPEAGVVVTVPQGALAQNTTITMTARAGSLVAYDFAPHGITFAKPLVFSQQLKGTNASLLNAPLIQLGYYSDASLLTQTGGLVSQLLGGTLNTLTWTFTAPIPHFSGYIVTCGRGG
jgi:ZU5 domain